MSSFATARRLARYWPVLAALAVGLPAHAQAPLPTPAIIVVDTNQILRDSKAAKDVQQQLKQQETAYSKEVSQQEADLKNMQDELERQRTVLAPDGFAARSQDFQRRDFALDRDVQMKRQALQQSLNDARDKINNAALKIITDIAKERKANMVVEKAALVYMVSGLDITAEVIQQLDKALPTLVVSLPKETPPQPQLLAAPTAAKKKK